MKDPETNFMIIPIGEVQKMRLDPTRIFSYGASRFLFPKGGLVHPALRRSIPVKVTATGFILFILFGNFWFIDQLMAVPPAVWVPGGFLVSIVLIGIGGIGMGMKAWGLHTQTKESPDTKG